MYILVLVCERLLAVATRSGGRARPPFGKVIARVVLQTIGDLLSALHISEPPLALPLGQRLGQCESGRL